MKAFLVWLAACWLSLLAAATVAHAVCSLGPTPPLGHRDPPEPTDLCLSIDFPTQPIDLPHLGNTPDNYGNLCDADYNDDCVQAGIPDWLHFRHGDGACLETVEFLYTLHAEVDYDSDGCIGNIADFDFFISQVEGSGPDGGN